MKAVLYDLDSTLCDTRHRQPMVTAIRDGRPWADHSAEKKATWLDYSLACADDAPIEGAVALVRLIEAQNALIEDPRKRIRQYAVSGRNESARTQTEAWLKRYRVPLDLVYLRADGDYTKNGPYKAKVIATLRESGIDVVLFVEDWQETADEVHELTGVPVLVVKGLYIEDAEGSI